MISQARFSTIRNAVAWGIFVVSLLTYWLTVAPTASYWDCPEYVASAVCLEPGHPPGNPFWMLAAHVATLLAPSPQYAALAVNLSSGLFSALTVLFLFLSISILCRRLLSPGKSDISRRDAVLVLAASATGSLALAWSDTFWFSAVEAEVYAMSSLFTALCVWAMLHWAEIHREPHADRWLVFVTYIMGLSIGVHQLNLLCIPALVLIFCFALRNEMSRLKIALMLLLSFVVIALILFGMMPGVLKGGSCFELWFVNGLGMPYNWGFGIFLALLATLLVAGIIITERSASRHRARRLVAWGVLMLFAGYSSYAVLFIRANAQPPMNQGDPSDVFALTSYLERDQYGSSPLLYGRTPYSKLMRREQLSLDSTGAVANADYSAVAKKNARPTHVKRGGRYVATDSTWEYIYTPELDMLLPRIFSSRQDHLDAYKSWLGMDTTTMQKVDVSYALDSEGNAVGRLDMSSGKRSKSRSYKPTAMQNLEFLGSYQIAYMYLRYMMWNFAGRQNDVHSTGEAEHGNFITGLPVLDNAMLGDQSLMPDDIGRNNPGHNRYFLLPLLLGLAGVIFQCRRGKEGHRQAAVIFTIFVMTGLAIVLYLNQTPGEPRERDYSFVGSVYAYCFWIGTGVAALGTWMRNIKGSEWIATVVGLAVAGLMFWQNLDDHDRSHRTAARDFAINVLESLEPDAVIFVDGDNNTFPLWYAQEVEGVRPDVRVLNLSYLSTPWYNLQLGMDMRSSKALPLLIPADTLQNGRLKIVTFSTANADTLDAAEALTELAAMPKPRIPARYLKITTHDTPVVVDLKDMGGAGYITRKELSVLNILTSLSMQDKARPIYWRAGMKEGNYFGLGDNMTAIAEVKKFTPGKSGADNRKAYDLYTTHYRFGPTKPEATYFDHTSGRQVAATRHAIVTTASSLLESGDTACALQLIELVLRNMPQSTVPFVTSTHNFLPVNDGVDIGTMLCAVGNARGDQEMASRGLDLLRSELLRALQWHRYYNSLPPRLRSVTTPGTRMKAKTFCYMLDAYRDAGGSLEDPAVKKALDGIDLDEEIEMWQKERLTRELIGTARDAMKRHGDAVSDSLMSDRLHRFMRLGGTREQLSKYREFDGFDFSLFLGADSQTFNLTPLR